MIFFYLSCQFIHFGGSINPFSLNVSVDYVGFVSLISFSHIFHASFVLLFLLYLFYTLIKYFLMNTFFGHAMHHVRS